MRESFRIAIIRRALHEWPQVDNRKRAVSRSRDAGAGPDTAIQQGSPGAAATAGTKSFSQEELDQLLAPIALYPDALLAQVLMASTYPLEIVSAERWVKANPSLKGKALEDALQNQPLGSGRQVAGGVPAGSDDDEREARLDTEARRRLPCAADRK